MPLSIATTFKAMPRRSISRRMPDWRSRTIAVLRDMMFRLRFDSQRFMTEPQSISVILEPLVAALRRASGEAPRAIVERIEKGLDCDQSEDGCSGEECGSH